ncbi:MAG TPA: TAT-variant-translocated molybdopterin oxidoreductase [Pyrinomonadaceae bacterium]|jgi:molybdopterin-containing oxidoreductase family iron-sulfur binding subunit
MHIKDTLPELYAIRRPLKTEDVRRRLADKQGKEYWRSLEELAASDEFEELLHREFPRQAGEWDDEPSRRTFLKVMGASLALAGLSGCVYQPPETAVPFVRQPEELVPGRPLFFATAMPHPKGATPLLVRSNDGRPTHIQGNDQHPASLGANDVFSVASLLTLYDPDRSATVQYRGEVRPYTAFLADARTAFDALKARGGAGLRILTETVTSPTQAALLKQILTALPQARWHQYEPVGAQGATAGARLAFGDAVNTVYRFDRADRVVALDSDFLAALPGDIRHARDFIERRRVLGGKAEMNRLYAVETTLTNTGAKADHRFAVKPSELVPFAQALAAAVGAAGVSAPASGVRHAEHVAAVAKDLQAARGKSIVIAGDYAPPAVHALAHAMNAALGNVGQTVVYTDPLEFYPADRAVDPTEDLRQLVNDIDAGAVEMLLVVGGNPAYDAPAEFQFKEKLRKLFEARKLTAHLGVYFDETSELCLWHVPETHYLEAWGDARAYDGTVSIIQPLIAPLYRGRSALEFLSALTDTPEKSGHDILRDYWRTQPQLAGSADAFEQAWRKAVHDGWIPGTAAKARTAAVRGDWATQPAAAALQPATGGAFEIVFRPDPCVYDGRYANNGWLQELPKPLTKLCWDNAVIVSPATARRLLQIDKQEDVVTYKGIEYMAPCVQINYRGQTLGAYEPIPIFVLAGQPDDVITLHLGYGRTRAGRVGSTTETQRVGFNAYTLRFADAPWYATGAQVSATGNTYQLVGTQLHFNMEGRDLVRSETLAEYTAGRSDSRSEHVEGGAGGHEAPPGYGPEGAGVGTEVHKEPAADETLYYNYDYVGYKWGMAIDTTACVGCNSCVIACVSENNIPVVGKEQVARRRHMHWLRVDAYFKGLAENPDGVYFQPVPCMHCESAPCEPVCPVNATVHDAEGTNNMVYNRCVGTRYCSNNCPYKVRRFNFLLFQDWNTPSLKLMRNPEVSVRSRGVMEKCTYCIQRIQNAKIESEKEGGRRVRDGEIQTACQVACPTNAIVFGDLNDRGSEVAKWQHDRRNYSLLAELNTRPRTTYLSALRNPNPEIKGA